MSDYTVQHERSLRATAPVTSDSFEEVVLPHLHAAHRLARWLMRNEHDAEDAVQEASLRAFRYFRTFTGGNGRAWFLRIVRNTCCGRRDHIDAATDPFDEERHGNQAECTPETLALHADDVALITAALKALPHHSRELLLLREWEGLSYRELSDVMSAPMGTVMSSLSRARNALRRALQAELQQRGFAARTHPRKREVDAVLV